MNETEKTKSADEKELDPSTDFDEMLISSNEKTDLTEDEPQTPFDGYFLSFEGEETPPPDKNEGGRAKRIVFRCLLSIFTFLLLAVFAVYCALMVVFKGPSTSARDKLVTSTLEMSAAKWVPKLFFSDAEIEEITKNNSVLPTDEITKPELITAKSSVDTSSDDEWADHPDGIRICEVKGDTYRGHVMIIRDPSKVYVATSSDFTGNSPGLRIMDVYNREGAVAAINGGGFPDEGGVGEGNVPLGLTISKEKLLWHSDSWYGIIGFDKNNVLIVGNVTEKQALDLGIRDCVSFGPILVVNGEPAKITGDSGSLNPRTAIGQRADGAVIFLCVDGRMPSSLGASYSDLIDIMLEFGAVNAANLDGGSSSHLIYNGEYLNVSSSLYGPRRMPTFFMVKGD